MRAASTLRAGSCALLLWALIPPETASGEPGDERWSVHVHSVVATQYHPPFSAPYSGANSLLPGAEAQTAFVSGLSLDVSPWHGTELIFDPEFSGGFGLSRSLGVAAFPSGIVYRVGDPAPALYVARLLIRQTFGLGGGKAVVEAGENQLAGTRDRNALTFSLGRMAILDVVDANAYAHDSQQQFFNWALFASGAYDYPADTRGYTWAAMADLTVDGWSARAGIALEPQYSNLAQMEWNLARARGLVAEYEVRYAPFGRRGSARALLFLNDARMGSYAQVLANPSAYGNQVQPTRAFGRKKYGAAVSVDQQLTDSLGAFLRASFNDGATETWAFTEIDRCLALGLVKDGSLWGWRSYEAGGAVVISGLSGLHRAYLQQGGYGFIIGDGRLSYAPEVEGDFYFRVQLAEWLQLSAIYQPILNPAFNRDRGPAHVFTGRVRVAF